MNCNPSSTFSSALKYQCRLLEERCLPLSIYDEMDHNNNNFYLKSLGTVLAILGGMNIFLNLPPPF